METAEECRRLFSQSGKRFAGYFLSYATEHQRDWQALDLEIPNLFPAAEYYRDASDYAGLLSLREALQPYLDLQGRWNDSLVLNEWTIALAQGQNDWTNVARLTHDCADMRNQMGQYREAEGLYQSSEETFLRLGQHELALRSRHMRSMVVRAQGHLAEAEALCEAVIEQAQQLGLERWLAHPLYVRALLARDRGDYARAKEWIEKSLSHLSVDEEPAMVAQDHHFLGELALLQDQLPEAHSHLETSLRLSEQVGILRRVAATQRLLGDLARIEKRYKLAEQLYCGALSTASRLGDRSQEAGILVSHGRLLALQGLWQDAYQRTYRAALLYEAIGNPEGMVVASLFLARAALRLGRHRVVLQLIGKVLRTAWVAHLLRPRLLTGMIRRGTV